MKKYLLIAGLALSLAACNTQTPATNTNTNTVSSTPAPKRAAMEWVAIETGTDASGMPSNKLSLRVQGTEQELFATSCNGTASTSVQDVAGSMATIQCWWAGGGDQFGVFIGDAEMLSIRHRTVDEEAGFGAWEEVRAK